MRLKSSYTEGAQQVAVDLMTVEEISSTNLEVVNAKAPVKVANAKLSSRPAAVIDICQCREVSSQEDR